MTTSNDNLTLDDELKTERRVCMNCDYEIVNPLNNRCPRCNAKVPRADISCGSCVHVGNCEFGLLFKSSIDAKTK